MPQSPHVSVNGTVVPTKEARVSVLDHAFLYGDGCHEALVVRDRRVFMFEEHLRRLARSRAALRIDVAVGRDEVLAALAALMTANEITDAYVKIVVSRGHGDQPIMSPFGLTPLWVMYADAALSLHPGTSEGVHLRTSSFRRPPADTLDPRVKSLNYLNSVLPKLEAVEAGADDALLLDSAGTVAESTAANVLVIDAGAVVVPDSSQALEGITREAVLRLCRELGMPVERRALHTSDVYIADEVLLTSTAGGVIPVTSVDGRTIGGGTPGPLTATLKARYDDELTGDRWTTPLPRS